MKRSTWLTLAFLLLLAALPVISIGSVRGIPALWWTGLALLAVGALVPPALRLLGGKPEPKREGEEEVGESPC